MDHKTISPPSLETTCQDIKTPKKVKTPPYDPTKGLWSSMCTRCHKHAWYRPGVDCFEVVVWCHDGCKAMLYALQRLYLKSIPKDQRSSYYERKVRGFCTETILGCLIPSVPILLYNERGRMTPRNILWDIYGKGQGFLLPECSQGLRNCCNLEHAMVRQIRPLKGCSE